MTTNFHRVLLGVAATTLLASTASASLLVNGSFEDTPFGGAEEAGVGAGWTGFGANFRVQQTGGGCDPISCAGAHDGTVSLKNFGEAGAFQDVAASAGESFEGSIYVINPLNADQMVDGQIAALNLEFLDSGMNNIGTELGDAVGADLTVDVWTQLTVAAVAPPDTAFVRFVLVTGPFAGAGGGAPRWDSAELNYAPIPVPGAILLMGSGLLGLLGFGRRKAA